MTSNTLMIERIKEQMKKTGIGARELAERAEVGRSFVYDVLSGKSSNPTTRKIAAVANVLGISVPYLLDENADPDQVNPDYVKIPFLAGYHTEDHLPIEARKEKPFYLQREFLTEKFNASLPDLRVIRVEGDSMEPSLCHNDLVLFDLSKRFPTPPGIFVLFDGIGASIKRIEYLSKEGMPFLNIRSDNPRYASYDKKVEEIRIIGRVIWFSRGI